MLLQHGRNRMLLFWVFKYVPSKSEIFLELNLRLINIQFKGRSASLPPGKTMETMIKFHCHMTMYQILSKDNPTDYPKFTNGPVEFSSYSSSGGTCTLEYGAMASSMVSSMASSMAPSMASSMVPSIAFQNCDCSAPKSYDFYDKGRF